MADGQGETLTYKEMRAVAQEIFNYEKKMRKIRTIAMIAGGLLMTTILVLAGTVLIFQMTADTEVQEAGGQSALVKKGTNRVVATTESVEDVDGADLVDYAKNRVDAEGDPDGDWLLSDSRIAMIRSISWKECDDANSGGPPCTTYVEHVAEIRRIDGTNASVEVTCKAGHKITIWDHDSTDNFNVLIKRWNRVSNTFDAEEEINAEGDEDGGRGRIMVSLKKPMLVDPPGGRTIKMDDYF